MLPTDITKFPAPKGVAPRSKHPLVPSSAGAPGASDSPQGSIPRASLGSISSISTSALPMHPQAQQPVGGVLRPGGSAASASLIPRSFTQPFASAPVAHAASALSLDTHPGQSAHPLPIHSGQSVSALSTQTGQYVPALSTQTGQSVPALSTQTGQSVQSLSHMGGQSAHYGQFALGMAAPSAQWATAAAPAQALSVRVPASYAGASTESASSVDAAWMSASSMHSSSSVGQSDSSSEAGVLHRTGLGGRRIPAAATSMPSVASNIAHLYGAYTAPDTSTATSTAAAASVAQQSAIGVQGGQMGATIGQVGADGATTQAGTIGQVGAGEIQQVGAAAAGTLGQAGATIPIGQPGAAGMSVPGAAAAQGRKSSGALGSKQKKDPHADVKGLSLFAILRSSPLRCLY